MSDPAVVVGLRSDESKLSWEGASMADEPAFIYVRERRLPYPTFDAANQATGVSEPCLAWTPSSTLNRGSS